MFEPPAATAPGTSDPYRALGVLTLPPRSHPLWADRNGVLLVRNGLEFDVPYIEWYRFQGSPASDDS